MDKDKASKIINYVTAYTKHRWQEFDEHWDKIDEVFIRRGYEQGGFEAWKFAELLKEEGILSIDRIGIILDRYNGDIKYDRNFAGSLSSDFYQNMKNGNYGEEGKKFYKCIDNFRGKPGMCFWRMLWQMLVCCNHLKDHYNGSFSYFLKQKYAEFKQLPQIQDSDFLSITPDEWQNFIKKAKPWKELYGIGENVFDFVVGDIIEANFVAGSYKLDSANRHFLKITGIAGLLNDINRENVIAFLSGLTLPYTLCEVNKGIYNYSGFCRNKENCKKCGVNDICEKKFDQ